MAQTLRASDVLDRFFLEMRCKVVDLAAAFDRIDRAAGSAELVEDERLGQLREAVTALLELRADRAERVQMIFSDAYEPHWPRPARRGDA